jgi:hypothetical protein
MPTTVGCGRVSLSEGCHGLEMGNGVMTLVQNSLVAT